MTRNVRKRTFGHVRPAKIQISLRFRAEWSESSMRASSIAKDAKFLRADKKDSSQTARTAHADLSLHWAYMLESTFSQIATHDWSC